MFLGETSTHGAARMHGFVFFTVLDSTSHFKNDLTQGDAHRHFDETRLDNVAADCKGLRAFGSFCPHAGIPGCAFQNDLRHIGISFNIIVIGWFTPHAFDRWERRTRTWFTAFTHDRSHQRCFFSADESSCADAHFEPATTYSFMGQQVTTLARPPGQLLCRVATVNDVHFGEVEAGRIDQHTQGPIQRAAPGEAPYPETMNRSAVSEIAAIDPAVVVVKGDLSQDGRPAEWAAFEACYRPPFGDRLHVVRGNHDAYHGQTAYAGDQWIELPGPAAPARARRRH